MQVSLIPEIKNQKPKMAISNHSTNKLAREIVKKNMEEKRRLRSLEKQKEKEDARLLKKKKAS